MSIKNDAIVQVIVNDEDKIVQALKDEEWTWRSVSGICDSTLLSFNVVKQVLKSLVRQGRVRTQNMTAGSWGLVDRNTGEPPDIKNSLENEQWWSSAKPHHAPAARIPGSAAEALDTHDAAKKKDPIGFRVPNQQLKEHEAKIREFARDLAIVMNKHKAWLGGCNCCSSPFGQVGNITFEHLRVDQDGYAFRIGSNEFLASVPGVTDPKDMTVLIRTAPPKDATPCQTPTKKSHLPLRFPIPTSNTECSDAC